jgi:hypothetical protein
MAVALVMPGTPLEKAPIKVLLFSVVFERPAEDPKKEFLMPAVFASPAEPPKKALSPPVVL